MLLFLAATLFSVLLAPPAARGGFDPALRWSTIETAHFYVHFHQDEKRAAAHLARTAEAVHDRLTLRLGWRPSSRTHVVLVDDGDEPGGSAAAFPRRRIVISRVPPLAVPGLGATRYDDWLELAFVHEYTHILQADMVAGLPRLLRRIFGRLYFPNGLLPLWMTEGFATYMETDLTAGGRGRSPGAGMLLCAAAREGTLPSLDRLSVFPDEWPAGRVPYIFGGSLVRFLAETDGEDSLAAMSRAYAGRSIPFLVESTWGRLFPRSLREGWSAWASDLSRRCKEGRSRRAAAGLTTPRKLTSRGYLTLHPAWSPDGSRIAFSAGGGDEPPGIYLLRPEGGGTERLAVSHFPRSGAGARIAWSPDGRRLFFSRLEWRHDALVTDIYSLDAGGGGLRRLTRGLRARDPVPTPDGASLLFVVNGTGGSRLALSTLPRESGEEITAASLRFIAGGEDTWYANPAWSPDGSRIAVEARRTGRGTEVRILSPTGELQETILHSGALVSGPAWSPDGAILFYSSDRDGVFDIYARRGDTGETFRVTRVEGGAFNPAPSPGGGDIAFTAYGPAGYDLATVPAVPARWEPVPAPPAAASPAPDAPDDDFHARPYHPVPYLAPRFWLPWVARSAESGTLYGLLTLGEDPLERHRYSLLLLHGPESRRSVYAFNYRYSGRRPALEIELDDTYVTHGGLLDGADYTERLRMAGVSLSLTDGGPARRWGVSGALGRSRLSALTETGEKTSSAPRPAEGVITAVSLGLGVDSTLRTAFSAGPERGRRLDFWWEHSDRQLGGDFERDRYTTEWVEYLPLPRARHVLSARLWYGHSGGDRLSQGAFELGGEGPPPQLSFSEPVVPPLAGYGTRILRGDEATLGTLSWRFPLGEVQRGRGHLPVFLRRVSGVAFAGAGAVRRRGEPWTTPRRSVGAEARASLTVAYGLPATLRLGAARGLDEGGGTVLTLALHLSLPGPPGLFRE